MQMDNLDALIDALREIAQTPLCGLLAPTAMQAADALKELRGERDDYKVQWQRDSTALGKTLNELSMKLAVIQDLRGELAQAVQTVRELGAVQATINAERDSLRAELLTKDAQLDALHREERALSEACLELRASLAAVKARLVSHAMACPVGDLWDFIRDDAALAASSPEAIAAHEAGNEPEAKEYP
jgi:uncharacterized coiled-coil DUF342 family protein